MLSVLILAPLNSISLPAPIATSTSPKLNERIILSEAKILSSAIMTPEGGSSLPGAVNLTPLAVASMIPVVPPAAGPAATTLIVPPAVISALKIISPASIVTSPLLTIASLIVISAVLIVIVVAV